jgi:hypothetical protein
VPDCWHGIPELMRLGILFTLCGAGLVVLIIGLFWLKDRLKSPLIARIAHSEPVMRLAVIGAAVAVIGLLLILSSYF